MAIIDMKIAYVKMLFGVSGEVASSLIQKYEEKVQSFKTPPQPDGEYEEIPNDDGDPP